MKKFFASLLTTFTFMFILALPARAATEVVSGDTAVGENMPGWLFNRDTTTSTPFEFNIDEASIGLGSLYVLPIGPTPANKFIAENFINTAIADVDSITYDFQIGPNGLDTQEEQFYMNVYANFGESDDLKFYDCRYNIVPIVGSTSDFTTVVFDPTLAYPVTTRGGTSASPHPCPAVPADMDSLSPGSNIRVFALNVGDTAAGDVGLDGYLDNVVVSILGEVTIYDFEPEIPELPQVTGMTIWQAGSEIGCGSTVSNRAITVKWDDFSAFPYWDHYQYQADDGVLPIDFTTNIGTNFRSGNIRDLDGTYQYRVRNVNMVAQTGEWSDWCTITLDRVDSDEDGVPESVDNCPSIANPDQLDTDDDGIGDACDEFVSTPPEDKDACKEDGWMSYDNPTFRNQGQCVSYVNHHDGNGNDDSHFDEEEEEGEVLGLIKSALAKLKGHGKDR